MLGLIVCGCAMLIGIEGWQSWQVYQTNIIQTDIVSSSTARSMAEQAETTLQTADTIVSSLVDQVEAEGTGPEALVRLSRLMSSLAVALPAIHEMGIVDSQGNAIAKSLTRDTHGLNYAERAYFQYHATHSDRGPFIGARIKSKIDGSYSITVTRRINNPDGSFGGLAVTSVSLRFFRELFDRLQAKSGGVISLLADDDTVLARSPSVPNGANKSRPLSAIREQIRVHPDAGSVTYVSTIDGVPRRGSYQHLGHFPLTTLVAQSESDVQSTWRAELRSRAIISVFVIVVVAILGSRTVTESRVLDIQARQDVLTGLGNRRSFDETIEREVCRAARSGQPLSLVMIDIDHFKSYNDCYGHPAGDECLRAVACTIESCLNRAGDFAARYGGEEIAVLLPGSDLSSAWALSETMRLAVGSLAIPQAPQVGGFVTFSAGVATSMPARSGSEAGILVRLADRALYEAKAAGRNTTKSYTPHLSGPNV